MNDRGRRIVFICIAAIFAVFMTVMNRLTPLYMDDYCYAFMFDKVDKHHVISGISDLIRSQYCHYFSMNGRTVTHTIAQLLLLMPELLADMLNGVMFALLGVCAYFHICGTMRELRPQLLGAVYALLLLSTPNIGQSYLWITGAANYLYGILIVLLYFIPFRIELEGKRDDAHPALKALLMLLFGVIAGWTNENNSIALAAMTVMCAIICRVRDGRIKPFMLTGLAGGIFGCYMMLFAQGELGRLSGVGGFGRIAEMLKNMLRITFNAGRYMPIPIVIFILALVLIIIDKRRQGDRNYAFLLPTFVMLLGFLGSAYSMSVAPYFPERAWSGPAVFMVISALSAWRLVDAKKRISAASLIAYSLIAGYFVGFCIPAFSELRDIRGRVEAREREIISAVEAGLDEVYVESVAADSRWSCFEPEGDLTDDPASWQNNELSNYYLIDRVIMKEEEK